MIDDIELEQAIVELLRKAVVELPLDITKCLAEAYEHEKSPIARMQLRAILDNIDLALKTNTPICQDTGIPLFFVSKSSSFTHDLSDVLSKAVEKATPLVPLRPNAVDPLSRTNPGTNVGEGMPAITLDEHDKPYTDITYFPKGAGSENMSRLFMLTPSEGVAGVKRVVLEAVVEAGGKPCPPTIVGVGIGGAADIAMKLAKKSLLRPLGSHNRNPRLASLEAELTEALNATGIGPMGLGGDTTVLGVHIKMAACHTASHPVAVNLQCWAARQATLRIHDDGRMEYL